MSPDKVRKLFYYDPQTGIVRWRVEKSRRVSVGSVVGTKSKNRLNVMIDYCNYKVHHICWAHYYGVWPPGELDHRDKNGLNNRIDNLREATRTQNMGNINAHADNIHGLKGVSKSRNRYVARIRGRRIGLYNTPEEAHIAYCTEAKKEYGEFFSA
jgi:hypothetical protein